MPKKGINVTAGFAQVLVKPITVGSHYEAVILFNDEVLSKSVGSTNVLALNAAVSLLGFVESISVSLAINTAMEIAKSADIEDRPRWWQFWK
jgi:hypothetical protein